MYVTKISWIFAVRCKHKYVLMYMHKIYKKNYDFNYTFDKHASSKRFSFVSDFVYTNDMNINIYVT